MRRVVCSLITMMLLARVAHAGEADPTEKARQLFQEARQRYQMHDYEGARQRFEAARAIKPMPEFDYNVGFCWDKLGRGDEALREYHKYLDAMPDAPNAAVVRARIAVLEEARAAAAAAAASSSSQPTPAEPAPASSRKRYIAPIAVGSAAVATLIVGSALVGSVKPDFDRLKAECNGMCDPSRWSGLEARANAGYALWGIAGALAIADAALWIVEVRGHRERPRASLPVRGSGGGLAVTF
jgi:tetratricopeptide (TPR) repeat protein